MKYRAQSAIEFMVLIGAVMFFFTLFFIAIHDSMSEKIKEQNKIKIEETANQIKQEIDFAFESTDGYQRSFTIPERVNNKEIDVSIIEGAVYLKTLDDKYAVAIPTHNVTGDLAIGLNTIRKQGGIIYLN